jgi:cell division septation protein DedD
MRIGGLFLAGILGAGLAGAAHSASLEISGPADLPPAGFSGRQFVDSAGCVFVRAGNGGTVSWVARVDRNRKQLCGYQPSFPTQAPATAVAVTPAAPASVAPPAAVSTPAAARPTAIAALPTTPPASGPVAPPVKAVAAPAAPGAYVSPYVSRAVVQGQGAAPLPTIVAVGAVADAAAICPNLSPVAQRYTLSDGRRVVRCGPQSEDPAGYINRAGLPGLQVAGIAPAATSATTGTKPIPQGYRAAWSDDRLNPNRGPRTAAGDAQMAMVWNDEVPARLVSGPRPVQAAGAPSYTTLSSKSPAAAATTPAAARFVQVGSYASAANADAARARLRALGLPVAASRALRGGTTLQVIFAGPFETSAALGAALDATRRGGFADAFTR